MSDALLEKLYSPPVAAAPRPPVATAPAARAAQQPDRLLLLAVAISVALVALIAESMRRN